ncbi:hypothetical protein PSTT_13075 [Puccinia striiformis]|uniref:Methionine aminopeptidase n=1 Tax=Puccinia striiformis TaxID=27350 RepID=A0A2S4UT97_9BASI|nr:hypothetical protein PSTT_13075 [Puccinia striiformis]
MNTERRMDQIVLDLGSNARVKSWTQPEFFDVTQSEFFSGRAFAAAPAKKPTKQQTTQQQPSSYSENKVMAEIPARPCSTNGCGKLASKLECPKCKQDPNLPSRFFCSQSCFKQAWVEHKIFYHSNIPAPVVPSDYKGPSETYDPFDEHNIPSYPLRNRSKETLRGIQHFKYTGPLRACYPVEGVPKRTVPDSILLRELISFAQFTCFRSQICYETMGPADYFFALPTIRSGCLSSGLCKGRASFTSSDHQMAHFTLSFSFITFDLLSFLHIITVQHGISPSEQAISGHRLGKPLKSHEIDGMRKVCKLAREVLDLAGSHVRPGITSLELDKIVHDACVERNSYPSPLGYFLFPRSVCISLNEVICHGIPDARPLEEGDIVNLDVTLFHEGFHGDLNATYPVGKISEESEHLIKSTRRCLDRAISICRPGTLFREIGNIIEPMAKQAGLNAVSWASQHTHYAKSKAIGEMKPGMVFTIEPMVNQGVSDEDHWPDNWTAVTKDGKRSAQFEETLLITENGVEVLTAEPGWKLPAEFEEVALGLVSGSQS